MIRCRVEFVHFANLTQFLARSIEYIFLFGILFLRTTEPVLRSISVFVVSWHYSSKKTKQKTTLQGLLFGVLQVGFIALSDRVGVEVVLDGVRM